MLAELIGLLAPCPALRHRLSVLQQRTEVAELGKEEGVPFYSASPPPGSSEWEWELAATALI